MRMPPWPIVGFVLLQLSIPIGVATGDTFNATVAGALVLIAAVLLLLWRGSQTAWGLLVGLELSVLVSQAFDPAPWWAWALNLAGLVLLLLPSSREHVWGKRTRRKRATA